jgi:hypothetical protein
LLHAKPNQKRSFSGLEASELNFCDNGWLLFFLLSQCVKDSVLVGHLLFWVRRSAVFWSKQGFEEEKGRETWVCDWVLWGLSFGVWIWGFLGF